MFNLAIDWDLYLGSNPVNTGLRIGEILSLTWESVDFEKNLLSVFAHKTNKIRTVPINTEAKRSTTPLFLRDTHSLSPVGAMGDG